MAAAFAAPCLSAHAADVFIGTDTVTIAAPAYSGNKVFEDTYIFDEDGGTLNFTGRQPRMTSGIVVNDNVHAAITSGTSILDVQMRFWTNPSNPDAGRMVLGENSVLEINLGGQPLTFNVPANYTTSGGSPETLSQLNSGEVLTLNLTIKKEAGGTDPDKTVIVLTTGQITAWNSQGTVEGEVQVNGNN